MMRPALLLLVAAVDYSDSFTNNFSRSKPVLLKRFACSPQKRSLLDQKGGLLYRTSLFNSDELPLVSREIESLPGKLQAETQSSVAVHRLGLNVPRSSPLVQFLNNPQNSLTQYVRNVCGDHSYELAISTVPVQLRSYERNGAAMAWHVDDVLFDVPQVEVVWTFSNTSDCSTLWKLDGNIRGCETDPNSLLLLRAGGVEHCVTSLRRGRRVILKCVYTKPGAKFIGEASVSQQFNEVRRRRKKR